MPYLRCEQCGAKALPIASRCPSCEHPFPSCAGSAGGRGFGGSGIGRGIDRRRERVCAGCDSLILRSADLCRWCGAPQDQGLSRRAIGGIGTAAAIAILAAGFHFWGPNADVVFLSGGSETSPTAAEVQPAEQPPVLPNQAARDQRTPTQPDAAADVSAETELADAGGATGADARGAAGADARPEGSGSPGSGSPGSDSGERVSAETGMTVATDPPTGATDLDSSTDSAARSDDQVPPDPDPPVPVSAETEIADDPNSGADAPTPESDSGWVRAVARTFVNVRAVPSSSGEVQGVVPENADVLLGDSRGAWRRIRMAGVTGWAWEPLFQIGSDTEGS